MGMGTGMGIKNRMRIANDEKSESEVDWLVVLTTRRHIIPLLLEESKEKE